MAEFDSVIPPGGSGKVVAKVHTRGQQGRRTKTIAVETDDPARRHVTLRLSFEARPLIMVLPRAMVNLVTIQGREAGASLVLRRGDGKPLRIERAESTRPGVDVTVEQVREEQPAAGPDPAAHPGDWRVRVRLASTREPRAETGRLRILTDHPQQGELSLPLRVQVRPAIEASPKAVLLRWRGEKPPPPAAVIIRHNGHRRFRVTGVELEGDLPGLSARVASGDAAPVQRAEIVVSEPAPPPGTHHGTLVVRTNSRKVAPLRVPVTLEVGKPDAAGAVPRPRRGRRKGSKRGDASATGGL